MTGPILVTGAGGCIGAWVIKILLNQGLSVIAYDLSADRRRAGLICDDTALEAVAWEQGDIADEQRLDDVIQRHGVSGIIHLAALQVPFCKADPRAGARVNVLGTVNVFEAARAHGIKHLTYASSVAAHGVGDTPWLKTLYGAYKLCDEHLAEVYWRDWQIASIGIRPNVVYGPARDQGMSSLPTLAMLAGVLGLPFDVPFKGSVGFLYAREAAGAFINSLNASQNGAQVFDLNGTHGTVEEVLALITAEYPGARLTCSGEALPFPGDLQDADLRAAVGDFGHWSLAQGVAETLAMFRDLVQSGQLSEADIAPRAP